MLAAVFATLLIADGAAVRLQELGELDRKTAIEIYNVFAAELRARTNSDVVLDDPARECSAPDRCAAAIRERTRMNELVFVRAFNGPTRILIEAERVSATPSASQRTSSVWLPIERTEWPELLAGLAASLFDAARPPASPRLNTVTHEEKEEQGSIIAPAVLLGASAVALVIGAVLTASSRSAADQQETLLLPGEQQRGLAARQQGHAIGAFVSFGVAGGALIGAAVTFFAD